MLGIGEVVRTSYGTGPYRITNIDGPCRCPDYLQHLDGDETESEEHYHLECIGADKSRSWLNGFRADGSSVWSDDTLIFDGTERFRTLDLFAVTVEDFSEKTPTAPVAHERELDDRPRAESCG